VESSSTTLKNLKILTIVMVKKSVKKSGNPRKVMPQEIEVWYLIPSLRRELTKILIKKHGLSQREVSQILEITEPAISQYLNSKRGRKIDFSPVQMKKIEKIAESIVKDRKNSMKYLYGLCISFRGSPAMCALHRIYDRNVSRKCKVCNEPAKE
jgi:hypothetical protein